MPIVDLEVAKQHLRVDHDEDDADIAEKLQQASDIVVNYLKEPVGRWEINDASGSDADDAPAPVVSAVLLVLGELYRNREADADPLSQGAKDLLHRYRDPAMA